MATQPILECRSVSKSFGAVQALYKVDFDVMPGEVMALVRFTSNRSMYTSTGRAILRRLASKSSTRTLPWPTT